MLDTAYTIKDIESSAADKNKPIIVLVNGVKTFIESAFVLNEDNISCSDGDVEYDDDEIGSLVINLGIV